LDEKKAKTSKSENTSEKAYELSDETKHRWQKFWWEGASLSCLIFAVLFPIGWLLLYVTLSRESPQDLDKFVWCVLATLPLYAVDYLCWLAVANEHELRAMSFTIKEQGLQIKSAKTEKLVPWDEIIDVFTTCGTEVVICTAEEVYYFPKDMDQANNLISDIKKRMRNKKAATYDLNMALEEGFRYSSILLGVAALSISSLLLSYSVATGHPLLALEPLRIFELVLVPLVIFAAWVFLYKIPILVRVGKEGIFIRDRAGERIIAWSKVVDVKNLGDGGSILLTDLGMWTLPWLSLSGLDKTKRFSKSHLVEALKIKDQFLEIAMKQLENS
jgi:hypothetical protein